MEKTIKVRCIDFFGITDYFTEGKIYDVVGEDGHDYIIVSDSGNRACWCKRWFEIVEEKPDYTTKGEASDYRKRKAHENNTRDMINGMICDYSPQSDANWYNTKDEINRILCNTYHIETPPDKKVEYHEPGFKSKWDTVGI